MANPTLTPPTWGRWHCISLFLHHGCCAGLGAAVGLNISHFLQLCGGWEEPTGAQRDGILLEAEAVAHGALLTLLPEDR